MKIKTIRKTIIKVLAISVLMVFFSNSEVYSQREKYNFNNDWKLFIGDQRNASQKDCNDSDWNKITLPHAWNQEEAFKRDIKDLSTGIAWYRKAFVLPESTKGSKVFIEFEGVRQMGEVYVNGQYTGSHENGVMAFGFDITQFLVPFPEENIIAVKTDNSWDYKEQFTGSKYQWNNINFNANYGGIPKNVFLHITPEIYQTLPLFSSLGTTGTYVYATDFNIKEKEAVVHVDAQVRNESNKAVDVQLFVSVEDMNGEVIAKYPGDTRTLAPSGIIELHASDTLNDLEFWSWGYGYLYIVNTELKVDGKLIDQVNTRTGFRATRFEKGMIWLNDRVIMMKGYAQRTSNEWPSVGMSVPAWLSDYSNSLIVEGNGNMVRWMHVTPWKQDIESCDRVGLIQAMPAGDAEKDVKGRRWNQRKELMRDAIVYNRNNPSILFYECGNEVISEEHMAEMKRIRNTYDPHGGRAIGSREMLDSKEAEYGGEMLYINKSGDIPFWAMEYSRDEGLRKYWDEYTPPYHINGDGPLYKGNSAADYNRNQDSHALEDIMRWFDYWEMRPGTGRRVSSGGANIIFSDSNTHHRGSENYRRSGEVDPMRILKENYFAHKVIWDGWVDTDSIDIHIIGHWNYEDEVMKDIYIVSTADVVELFVNDKSLGKGEQSKQFLFTFKDVAYEPGSIKAVGYSEDANVLCQAIKTTAGEPAAIKLSSTHRPGGMLADGQDLAIIEVEVVDGNGNRCPTALNMVNFNIKGAGEYLGGIAQGPDNYIGAKSLPVECGVNRVFIKSNLIPGKIKIQVSSEGLKSAKLNLETVKTDLRSLSETMPDDKLPSYLKKGPTPDTPSFKISRTPVEIVSAKAASNQSDVGLCFDDNELSEWRNDDILAHGKIEFELERSAKINQAVIKFSGWRRRSYPIAILVDEKEVFRGESPRSLGYVTFNFDPTEGRKVSIELIGAAEDRDAYNIVEITGKVDNAGLDQKSDQNEKGSLRIVELEFYEQFAPS